MREERKGTQEEGVAISGGIRTEERLWHLLSCIAKWLSEEALQIAVKREAKSKGEKERYKYLNAEFQRIARRF